MTIARAVTCLEVFRHFLLLAACLCACRQLALADQDSKPRSASPDSEIRLFGHQPIAAHAQSTFLALDDFAIPMTRGLELRLQQPQKLASNPIVARGGPGRPDAKRASCPAVIHRHGKWHMWYVAMADDEFFRVAYPSGNAD